MQRYCLDIVERELAEVNLAVLCVAKFYAVVDYAGVVCAHRADIHSLYTSDSTIILYLHTGEIPECISDAVGVKALQFFPV